MKINQTWNKQPRTVSKLVPLPQVEAAVRIASENSMKYAIQLCQEQMLLTLHDEFGFGRDRCMRALGAMQEHLNQWRESVEKEFDAETFRLSCKQKNTAEIELAWTFERHDAALKPLVDPEIWRPYQDRYGDFGGRGSWCKKE